MLCWEAALLEIINAETDEHIAIARELFLEYADSLGFSLCFQNFEQELAGLPGRYAAPAGRLLLALDDGQAAGCAALQSIDEETCEMKRLYVRPAFRGRGIGRTLAQAVIAEAREIGYTAMRLDTIPSKMAEAVVLYERLGFREIPPYRENPFPEALYMELALRACGCD
jgi:ribosomal protein S18 acetylase RimI-like enzyme